MSRYSQLYIERGRPLSDSSRFRNRLAAYASDEFTKRSDLVSGIIRTLQRKLGVEVPVIPNFGRHLPKFFKQAELRDVLDAVTIAYDTLLRNQQPQSAQRWLDHVAEVLSEENLAFRVDRRGIVVPFVDEEFDANRAAALSALSAERFGEARQDFDAAFRHLRNGEGKQAIRMMFPAVEVAAKVLHPGALSRLMPNEVDSHLRPKLEVKYAGNQPAIDAGKRLLAAFKEWINASQPYRHGQEVQEPAEPPQEFVVAHLSAGAAFLRWMIELSE